MPSQNYREVFQLFSCSLDSMHWNNLPQKAGINQRETRDQLEKKDDKGIRKRREEN